MIVQGSLQRTAIAFFSTKMSNFAIFFLKCDFLKHADLLLLGEFFLFYLFIINKIDSSF